MILIIGGCNSLINRRIFASKLALDLSEADFVIVSGITREMDTVRRVEQYTKITQPLLLQRMELM
ncbi:hypothetical protein GOY07_00860 [Wolbachia endosymbiont of Litomosoides sigmodontis]|uniref:hypothetical protein n=1 Tax=Wolbachia endosymbiont of Litomosoides sigmodontis TaxID=80850 RepID=UPI00158A5965|nr:hypothetical protein [Wolbachia endosymbiont of Litomosoides sigmodontis]QKX02785.1 hypothetical protein GOY07_00860 [Wolbachia endosymbiont of Litomosoides sigmodontis]